MVKTLASASADKTIKLWDLQGQLLRTFIGHKNVIFSIAFSPDGQTLASASADKTIKLWNLQGQLLHTFTGYQDASYSAFTSDGRYIAAADDVTSVVFSPDGKYIASAIAGQDNQSVESRFG